MRATNRELLLRGILRESIDKLNKAIASEEKIIELSQQMDFRNYGKVDPSKYIKLQLIINDLTNRRAPYMLKLAEIDEKIEDEINLLEEKDGNNDR